MRKKRENLLIILISISLIISIVTTVMTIFSQKSYAGECATCGGTGRVICSETVTTTGPEPASGGHDEGCPYADSGATSNTFQEYKRSCSTCGASDSYYLGACTGCSKSYTDVPEFQHNEIVCAKCNGTGICNHTWGNWEPGTFNHSRTCTKCGATESAACEFKPKSIDDKQHYEEYCEVCGQFVGMPENHQWQNGTCTVCNYECLHNSHGDWYSKNEDTAYQYHYAICDNCGMEIKKEHDYNSAGICGGCGYVCPHISVTEWQQRAGDDTYHYATCPTCGNEVVSRHTFENNKCSLCEYELTQAHTHDYTYRTNVVPPTCTSQGYTQHICTCGDTYIDTYTNALGHDATSWTDNGNGTHSGTCTRCNEAITENHKEVVDEAIPATCTTPGKTEGKHCSECNAIIVAQTTINALGHDVTSWTDNGNGTHSGTCTRCNETQTQNCTYGTDGKCVDCGATQNTECEHDYQLNKALSTQTQHYRECTNCGDKKVEQHTFSNGVCTVCDYQCAHTYEIKKDATYHWKECTNCGYITEKQEHDYTNGDCECGAKESDTECKHINTTPKKDETYHWKECNDCGEVLEKTQHNYVNGECECGAKEPSQECKHANREWKADSGKHWQVCKECGKEIPGTRGEHVYVDGKCKNCGLADNTGSNDKLPNTGEKTVVITTIILAVMIIGGVIGIRKYKEI